VSVNFDAKLSLDVSQFLSGVKKAEGALKSLEAQIGRINSRNLSLGAGGGALAASAGSSISRRRAEAALEQSLVEKMTKTEMSNAKVQWQSEMMRQKAMDSRLRDHQTISSLYDQEIAREQRSRREASNAIRAQMQEREQMNKLHARANVMNQRFDAARANQSQAALRGIARERYALYDVAAAYAAVAAASIGTVTAVVGTAAQYERAFANVARTTEFTSIKVGEAARVMRFELMQLANEIPVTFGQITEIATIGNQLGIAQGDLVNFTETVAKFAATTDVTIQNAAMSFGRIGELLDVSDFNALGSAIAFAGVNAVATETQILSVTKEIATTAKQAKFTAAETIGLATALGSLGIAPEAARGSIIRSFAAINGAISAGGAKLQAYANISGMTAEEFASTWQQSGAKAFNALLSGLQAASDSGQNLDSVLRSLGVKNVRDIQTLQKLGDNYDVYAQSIRDANQAFEEGTFLSEAYGVIQETVAAKLGVIQNQISNLFAGMGESTTGSVKVILDVISDLLTALQQFSRNPAGQAAIQLAIGFAAIVAAIASVNAVAALGRAAMLAYASAMGTAIVSSEGLVIGLRKAATAAKIANVALKSVGIGLAIGTVVAAVGVLGDEMQKAGDKAGYLRRKGEEILGGFGGLQEALTKDLEAYQTALEANNQNQDAAKEAAGIWYEVGEATQTATGSIDENAEAMDNLATFLGITETGAAGVNGELEKMNIVLGQNTIEWLRNAIMQSETFRELANNKEAMEALIQSGFNLNTALQAAANGTLSQYMQTTADAAMKNASAFEQWTYDMYKNGGAVGWLLTLIPRLVNELTRIFGIELFPVSNGLQAMETAIAGSVNEAGLLGPAMQKAAADSRAAADGAGELDDQLKGASKTLRTVVDYANDLRGVFQRLTDIKIARQLAKDEIADAWANIAEKATDAEDAIRDANAEIQELTADRGVLEYQLSVAQRYGDEKRAAVLRAKLAKIDGKMADAQDDLKQAQEDANKSLVGNTKAARENRQELSGMVNKYQDYILALVESGLKGKALADAIDTLKRQFREQAIAAGYAEDELKPYLDIFDGFKETVEKMPRRVDIEFNSNVSAAQQALREYEAKLNALNGKNVTSTITTREQLVIATPPYTEKINGSDVRLFRLGLEAGKISYKDYVKAVYGLIIESGTGTAGSGGRSLMLRAQGGPVFGPGTSTSDSIPAMLSNGEYVVRAKAVRAYGLDFMNSLNRMKPVGSMSNVGGGAIGNSGVTIAQLSPEDRALLRAAVDRPINLYADSKKIAQTANDGNNLIARRGVR
jgi:TP901 family phage tail tape measure protein